MSGKISELAELAELGNPVGGVGMLTLYGGL